ncbi:MAG TPA: YwmB family TATA-box binding protein [Candidatus Udaeobacter sp.]|nr:YwmB family TATA-box binding protein [Candidatus Udaeobacter sp.]
MYIPKKMPPVSHRLSAKQRAKQTKAGVIAALIVILLSAAWAMWQADRAPRDAAPAEQMLQHDLQELWLWSDNLMKSGSKGAEWTIRWNVTGKDGAMKELVQKLFTDEQGKAINNLEQNEGKTVSGAIPAYSGRISINLVQTDGQREQLMVLLEASGLQLLNKNVLFKATADISEQIAFISPAFTSSLKVQGYTGHDQTINRMVKLTNARSVDRYEDGGTISETFFTRMLHSAIFVENGKSANFQIALHKETNSNNTELTIGIPVISGEYSVFKAENP